MTQPVTPASNAGDYAGDSLNKRLQALERASRKELIALYAEVYGRKAPAKFSQHILRLAIGYRLQEEVFGGLRADIRKQLLSGRPTLAKRKASVGTVFVREWQGREYTVSVHPDHVEHDGQRFRSLTQVVHHITGQKRSGPAFFGLRSDHA